MCRFSVWDRPAVNIPTGLMFPVWPTPYIPVTNGQNEGGWQNLAHLLLIAPIYYLTDSTPYHSILPPTAPYRTAPYRCHTTSIPHYSQYLIRTRTVNWSYGDRFREGYCRRTDSIPLPYRFHIISIPMSYRYHTESLPTPYRIHITSHTISLPHSPK